MVDRTWETDEDRMIYKLSVHKNLVAWTIDKLEKAGIKCKRTTGNDPKGDIVCFSSGDEKKVKEIVKNINMKYNS